MHRAHRSLLLAVTLTTVALLLPAFAGTVAAANTTWAANCDSTNLRTSPKTSATIKGSIAANTVVTASDSVTGSWYSASCLGKSVSGSTWLKIVAVDGKSVSSLYGVSAVYGAKGLFRSVIVTTDYLSNCSVRLRSSASTSAGTKAIIASNTVVTSVGTVSGSSWKADCATTVSGSSWLKITAVNGKSTSSLYGVSAVYAATGLFRKISSSGSLEGIDVSVWQGTIDWGKVRAAGKRFAIAKATEGIGFEDSSYDRNKAGAMAAGVAFGAYHFARPGSNDPVKEADWFVNTAGYQRGMIIPTLDLERTGGLGTTALTNWVKAWLARVDARLGVKAMIYTSPSFWRTYMGDSRWFADNGYAILWTAHWDVTSPSVPASNWGGRSWTFWQYDNCGSVPGISGCVDLDRYRFSSFSAVTY